MTEIYPILKKKIAIDLNFKNITGLILDPYFSATKIKWIIENNKLAKKTLKKGNLLFGTIDTWLIWNLTNKKSHLTDITNASRTMLFDPKKEEWSKTLLNLFKIPNRFWAIKMQNNLWGDNKTNQKKRKILRGT